MTEPKFKAGDWVRVISSSYQPEDGSRAQVGAVRLVKSDRDTDGTYEVYSADKTDYWYFNESDLRTADRTWDTLTAGDIIVDTNDNQTTKVLAVVGSIFARSFWDDYDRFYEWVTIARAKARLNWKIQQDEPTEDIVELTLEEVAKLKGVDVSRIRIKDGDE